MAPPSAAAAAPMDLSKVGSPSRKPTDEKKSKKEIEEFMKKAEMAEAKGDEAMLMAMRDFPLYMATDDMKGMFEGTMVSKEQFVAMMKQMENMPKDIKMTHKPTISVLSDSLANVVDDFTMTMGKMKVSGRNAALLVKVDGNWKWKSMVEAGWGGMMPEATKAGAVAAPAMAPAPAKSTASAAPAPATAPPAPKK